MREAAIRWLGAIGAIAIVVPILFYGVTGAVIGLLLPCGPEGSFTAISYRAADVTLSCGLVGTTVKLTVALWGTTVVAAGAFLLAAADLLGR